MHSGASGPHKKARIEIIPLIDIMFFLLASFMLVSMSMVKLQKIESHLPPKSKAPPSQNKKDFVIIGIDKDGNIYFDKDPTPIPADQIASRLQPFYAKLREEARVYINCDKDASYDQLIQVLDQVRLTGIKKMSFALKNDNIFDPTKPRPSTHEGLDAAGGVGGPAAPGAPPASAASTPPAANP